MVLKKNSQYSLLTVVILSVSVTLLTIAISSCSQTKTATPPTREAPPSSSVQPPASPTTQQPDVPVVATITSFRGHVQIKRADGIFDVKKPGVKLFESDIILTGRDSSCDLAITGFGVAQVKPQSALRLNSIKQGGKSDIRIGQGRIICVLNKLKPEEDFTISTPVIVAGIRGTSFSVGYTPTKRRADVAVLTGRVAVQSERRTIIVPEKQVLRAAENTIGQPTPINPALLNELKSVMDIRGIEQQPDFERLKKNIAAIELEHRSVTKTVTPTYQRELTGSQANLPALSETPASESENDIVVTNRAQLEEGRKVRKNPGFHREEDLMPTQ